ncbi:MAG: hypothetical protein WC858_01235 [Parcubacteria group bacterium]|jgi:hypothetical protein
MKKTIKIAAIAAVFALTATASFASVRINRDHRSSCCDDRHETCCPSVNIDANTDASVRNNVSTNAGSGSNFVSAGYFSSVDVDTGATTASSVVGNDVEGTYVDVTAPVKGSVDVDADSNGRVSNNVRTNANSGRNVVVSHAGRVDVDTGNSSSGANVQTKVVGSTVTVR